MGIFQSSFCRNMIQGVFKIQSWSKGPNQISIMRKCVQSAPFIVQFTSCAPMEYKIYEHKKETSGQVFDFIHRYKRTGHKVLLILIRPCDYNTERTEESLWSDHHILTCFSLCFAFLAELRGFFLCPALSPLQRDEKSTQLWKVSDDADLWFLSAFLLPRLDCAGLACRSHGSHPASSV